MFQKGVPFQAKCAAFACEDFTKPGYQSQCWEDGHRYTTLLVDTEGTDGCCRSCVKCPPCTPGCAVNQTETFRHLEVDPYVCQCPDCRLRVTTAHLYFTNELSKKDVYIFPIVCFIIPYVIFSSFYIIKIYM